MPDFTQVVAAELCQLDPVQLDAFVQDFPGELPMSNRTAARMTAMAELVLRHESPGDALARIERYRRASA